MNYRIYKTGTCVNIVDENDKIFECHCSNVIVTKRHIKEYIYTIIFNNQLQPENFYDIPFENIFDESGTPFAAPDDWEKWYQLNTGEGCGTSGGTISVTVAGANANLQAGSYESSLESTTSLATVNPSVSNLMSISFLTKTGTSVISLNGGATVFKLEAGESVNISADGLLNTVSSPYNITWDTATYASTLLLVIYTYQ